MTDTVAAAPGIVVVGTVLQAPTPDALDVRRDVAVVVDTTGRITAIHPASSPEAAQAVAAAARVVRLGTDERLLPGLVDLHVHAPQWPQLGTGLDLPLERWLFEYTFPLEARYADAGFATSVWDHMVPALLAHGTTTAVYFVSIHEDATVALAEACVRHGQRGYVGRVAMDHPDGTPEWYRDVSAEAGVASSARSVDLVRSLRSPLVQPVITPRFVPACTDDLLTGLGELAAATGALVQTHCSESDWQHGEVLHRFGRRDADVLHGFGLLRPGTVLAHGNHLDAGDFALLVATEAGVAHCPLSNSYFANAVFPVARALADGVRIGLGSDVAGGSQPGLLPQCQHAVTVSRMLDDGVDARIDATRRGVRGSRVDVAAALHLATAGGANVLGADVGVIAPGGWFDAIVVQLGRPGSPLRRWDDLDDEVRIAEKIVRLATPADIAQVWVAGHLVAGTTT